MRNKFRSGGSPTPPQGGVPPDPDHRGGSVSCGKCVLCKYVLVECSTFKSYESPIVHKIDKEITCKTVGVIYLIKYLICKKSKVGSAITNMRTRWSNHKYHIKIEWKSSNIATHVRDHPLAHTMNYATDMYDDSISGHFSVTLIDTIDFEPGMTTKQKRKAAELLEGKWIDTCKTLELYGGLNSRDEGTISRRRE